MHIERPDTTQKTRIDSFEQSLKNNPNNKLSRMFQTKFFRVYDEIRGVPFLGTRIGGHWYSGFFRTSSFSFQNVKEYAATHPGSATEIAFYRTVNDDKLNKQRILHDFIEVNSDFKKLRKNNKENRVLLINEINKLECQILSTTKKEEGIVHINNLLERLEIIEKQEEENRVTLNAKLARLGMELEANLNLDPTRRTSDSF